jgi:hypothetical protein
MLEPLKSMSLLLKAKHWAKFMVLPPLIVTSNNIQVNNFVFFCFFFFLTTLILYSFFVVLFYLNLRLIYLGFLYNRK